MLIGERSDSGAGAWQGTTKSRLWWRMGGLGGWFAGGRGRGRGTVLVLIAGSVLERENVRVREQNVVNV